MIRNVGMYRLQELPEQFNSVLNYKTEFEQILGKKIEDVSDSIDICFVMPVESDENFQRNYSKNFPMFTNPTLKWARIEQFVESHQSVLYIALKV